jgi:hypothetical protein
MSEMKRAFGILSIALIGLLASSVFAQELMEKTEEKEVEATAPMQGMMGSGMMGRMMPMMQGAMGQQGMMGSQGMMNMMPMMQGMMSDSGMMGGGMMCPMCGKMMGQGMMSGPGMMTGFGKPDLIALAEKLDLSEEQIAEIKGIFLSHKKDMIRKKADRDIAELDLSELTQQDEPDLNAVEDKLRDIANLEAGIRFSQIKVWTDAKSVLTTEQKAVLKRIVKKQKTPMIGQKNVEKTETSMPGTGGHSEHH